MPEPTEDLISSQEALEILGVVLSTLTRWAADGKITPALKMPGSSGAYLWRRSDVVQLAADRAASTAPADPAVVTA